MTDDLFDDFDLKDPVADNKNKINDAKEEEKIDEHKNPSKISSENAHPDIFPVENMQNDGNMTDDEMRHLAAAIDAESAPQTKTFNFSDDSMKTPFRDADVIQSEFAAAGSACEIRTIDKIRRSNVVIDPENFGDTLRKLRESACVSLADLSEELKIKESFLAALEKEDYNNLPPEVFIVAYIRKLGGVYHLTEEEIVMLAAKVRARMEIELPEDMDKVVAIYEPSEENENKLRHIITLFSVIAAVAVILIGLGVYFFVSTNPGGKDNEQPPRKEPAERFSAETLLELQPEVKLKAIPLKINK